MAKFCLNREDDEDCDNTNTRRGPLANASTYIE